MSDGELLIGDGVTEGIVRIGDTVRVRVADAASTRDVRPRPAQRAAQDSSADAEHPVTAPLTRRMITALIQPLLSLFVLGTGMWHNFTTANGPPPARASSPASWGWPSSSPRSSQPCRSSGIASSPGAIFPLSQLPAWLAVLTRFA